ncbi:GNAT family N-acetyltransferase [Terriglobus sp. TAA 43]|uniref:GNAT family N-acetyltransferase n=1 Tax=Terriglobus sp. TAA 43 TaxID=278961 RepID=UPI0006464219|nr:GNAT family N-acetyltransferase [Terriglobus sp. TAA 43]
MVIRPVEDDDIPAMVKIRAVEWGDEAYWLNRITAYRDGKVSPQYGLPERALFVAIEDESIVGFVAGNKTTRHACQGELEWLNVAAQKRGLGIADQLIARMGAWFVQQGAGRVCVNAAVDNVAARRVYGRCGAEPMNDHWMIWADARRMVPPPSVQTD